MFLNSIFLYLKKRRGEKDLYQFGQRVQQGDFGLTAQSPAQRSATHSVRNQQTKRTAIDK